MMAIANQFVKVLARQSFSVQSFALYLYGKYRDRPDRDCSPATVGTIAYYISSYPTEACSYIYVYFIITLQLQTYNST